MPIIGGKKKGKKLSKFSLSSSFINTGKKSIYILIYCVAHVAPGTS